MNQGLTDHTLNYEILRVTANNQEINGIGFKRGAGIRTNSKAFMTLKRKQVNSRDMIRPYAKFEWIIKRMSR